MSKKEFIRKKPKTGNTKQIHVFVFRFTILLIMLLGCWVSTQYFAKLVGYSTALCGYPAYITDKGYPVYYPWMYLSWLIDYLFKPEFAYIKKALKPWFFITTVSVALFLLYTLIRGLSQKAENLYGSTRLATKKDLEQNGLLTGKGTILGMFIPYPEYTAVKVRLHLGNPSLHLIREMPLITQFGTGSTIVIAYPRSGKGVSVGIPSLLNHNGSLIAVDFKGENYIYTSGYRRQFSYTFKWAPSSDDSVSFNFLMEIRKGEEWSDAIMLATTLLAPQTEGREDENSAHFRVAAIDFLTGTILHVLCSSFTDKTLGGCLDFLSGIQTGTEEEREEKSWVLLRSMIEAEHCSAQVHAHVVGVANRQLERPSRERGSVFSSVFKGLSVFEDPKIRKNCTAHDFSYASFIDCKHPVSLYITLSNAKIDQTTVLLRLFISMMLRRLSDAETSYDQVFLKNQLLFFIDEFTAMPAMNFLQKAMAILPGYGVKFMLICQSMSQLNAVYGNDHQFLSLVKHIVTFAPGDIQSAKLFCETIGKESVWKSSTSISGNKMDITLNNLNQSGTEIERNLINPDELMKLPYNDCLIFTQGMPVTYASKVVSYEDSRFMHKIYNKKNPNPELKPLMKKDELLKECSPLRKIKTDRQWYELPLWTTLEKVEDIVYSKNLIDPRLSGIQTAQEAIQRTEENAVDAKEITNLSALLAG